MKKKFEIPELDIVMFNAEDIIVTSAGANDPWGGQGDESGMENGDGDL